MPRTHPLITPEELQCLLGGAAARHVGWGTRLWHQVLYAGAALWLLKGLFLYAVLITPEAAQWVSSSLYLGMRGTLELVCLTAFWGAALHPRGRLVGCASMLVGSTTLLMDAMTLLAFAG